MSTPVGLTFGESVCRCTGHEHPHLYATTPSEPCYAAKRADALLTEGLYLCMYGERPPGGEDATWGKWARQVEAYLREGMACHPAESAGGT